LFTAAISKARISSIGVVVVVVIVVVPLFPLLFNILSLVEESWRGAVGGGMSVALELRSIAKVGACEICSYCSEREKEHCWPAPLVVVEVQKLVKKKKKKKLNTITKASSSDRAGLSPCTRRRRRLWSMYSSDDD
jgi:hypothetical protein